LFPLFLSAADRRSPQVLVLHSYHAGYAWTDDIMRGILSTFQRSGVGVDSDVEYMDSRRHSAPEDLQQLYVYYRHKFKNLKFDVIISSDNAALELLLKHQDELFPQTPVAFCGVETLEQYSLANRSLFTGVIEATEDLPTVAAALKLHPKARRVVSITDYQPTLQAARVGTAKLQTTFPQLEIVFIDPRSLRMSDLVEKLKGFPAESTIGLLGAFFRNDFGETFTVEDVTRRISQTCPFPLYGVHTNTFGHGIVGGKLNNGFFQGAEVTRRALAILRGTSPADLPISAESPNRFQFDDVQLKRWRIDRSQLPPDSLIANEPVSLYDQYKHIVWSVFGFLVLQSVVISALLLTIQRRKKAETLLRESEASLEEAQSIAHIGSWDHDLVKRRLHWSNETYRIFGYGQERPLACFALFIERVHPDDRERVIRAGEEARASGQPFRAEHRIIRPDGSERLVVQQAELFTDSQGKVVRMIGTTQDITDIRHLEDQLRHSQKLEALGQLAGGIAHDFNNVLTAINGYSNLVLQELRPQDPLRPELEEIRKAGERAATLTQQLLAFSRKQVLQLRTINLNTIVADMDKMLRRLLGADIELLTHLAPDLGYVKADAGQIEQVILNLALNARDAMPAGGQLTVETANAALDEEYARMHHAVVPGRYALLAVTDMGCGMDAATQARIFEPFFTTKQKGKGTGLGLSTVYGIVKQSGGFIWIYSEPGHGSTFKIYLPLCDDAVEEARPVTRSSASSEGSETVLVVEDDPTVCRFVCLALARNGYQVLEASNGKQALEVCDQHLGEIRLLVTDLVMPEMGGQQLAEILSKARPEIRILYLSGYTQNSVVRQGTLHSEVTFLQKPFAVEALLQRVRQILNGPAPRVAGSCAN
jgi:PAS domain S-box-containing protein